MASSQSGNPPTPRDGSDRPLGRRTRDVPYEIAVSVAYAILAGLWVFFSDHLLAAMAGSPERLRQWSIYKGWIFVGCTALLLYVALRRIFSRIRRGQQQLVKSRHYFNRLLDASPLPIGVARLDGTIEYLNDRFVRTFGYEMADIPTVEAWAARVYPDAVVREQALAEWQRRVRQAIDGSGEIVPMEVRIICKQGTVRDVVVHAAIMGDRHVSIFDDVTDRKRVEEQLRGLNETLEQRVAERTALAEQRAAELRALAQQLTQAEQKERRRVAQILHEHFQQLLVAAKFNTDALRRHPARPQAEVLQKINAALDEAIRVSRLLTVELSPPILYDLGLMQALCWLGRWMQERHGLRVDVRVNQASEPADQDLRVALFQAVRELLFNVVKHAGVDAACVEAAHQDGWLRITVSDAGAGFDASNRPERQDLASGFGLFSIRERLAPFGGEVEVDTAPGRGTRVALLVPRGVGTEAR